MSQDGESRRPGSERNETTDWQCTNRNCVNNGRAPEGQAPPGAAFLLTFCAAAKSKSPRGETICVKIGTQFKGSEPCYFQIQ